MAVILVLVLSMAFGAFKRLVPLPDAASIEPAKLHALGLFSSQCVSS
jgi:hypothetical protein